MKILVQLGLSFTKATDPNHLNIAFNWMLEDGTIAGSLTTPVQYPNQLSADALNTAVIRAVVQNINSSGVYTVAGSDKIVMLNSFMTSRAQV